MSANKRKPVLLSDLDKERLTRYAPLFGLNLLHEGLGRYVLHRLDQVGSPPVVLCAQDAHLRLLSELCERTAPWVYYRPDTSCAISLLRHSEQRICRFSELYRRTSSWRPQTKALQPKETEPRGSV